jgi:phosphoribosylcarboxyaminoimidazole (NCAIR) mutase
LAAAVLALGDPALSERLQQYRSQQTAAVLEDVL